MFSLLSGIICHHNFCHHQSNQIFDLLNAMCISVLHLKSPGGNLKHQTRTCETETDRHLATWNNSICGKKGCAFWDGQHAQVFMARHECFQNSYFVTVHPVLTYRYVKWEIICKVNMPAELDEIHVLYRKYTKRKKYEKKVRMFSYDTIYRVFPRDYLPKKIFKHRRYKCHIYHTVGGIYLVPRLLYLPRGSV